MLLVALGAALALAAPTTPPDPFDPPLPRPMSVETTRDTITDEVRVSAILRDATQRLTLTCDPHDHEFIRVTFTSMRWLVRGNFITRERALIYRFDDLPARRRIWLVKDREARLGGRERVTEFLREMIGARELVFRTRDVESNRIELRFRIVGARAAVQQLLEACGETILHDRWFGPPAAAARPPV
ncbi:MAG TPA: hypothetical protein VMS43_04530 [Allosphingosinicella sp.]|nr:hypothetical protein [Allosphingosinicella sp.]